MSTTCLWIFIICVLNAGYPFFIHPFLARALAVLFRMYLVETDLWPSLTILIPAANEGALIRAKLENTLAQEHHGPKPEIIVISDASEDDTDDQVRQFADHGVKLVRQESRQGKLPALYQGHLASSGDVLVLTDVNVRLERDTLINLVRPYRDPKVGIVSGNFKLDKPTAKANPGRCRQVYRSITGMSKVAESLMGRSIGSDGQLMSIRRELYPSLEECPPHCAGDLSMPLIVLAKGYSSLYVPEAVAYGTSAARVAHEYKRIVRMAGQWWSSSLRMVPLLLRRRAFLALFLLWGRRICIDLLPVWLLGAATSCALLAPQSMVFAACAALMGFVVVMGLLGLLLERFERRASLLMPPAVFLVSMVGLLVGFVTRLFGRRSMAVWDVIRTPDGQEAPEVSGT